MLFLDLTPYPPTFSSRFTKDDLWLPPPFPRRPGRITQQIIVMRGCLDTQQGQKKRKERHPGVQRASTREAKRLRGQNMWHVFAKYVLPDYLYIQA